jgi:hypothetical protein
MRSRPPGFIHIDANAALGCSYVQEPKIGGGKVFSSKNPPLQELASVGFADGGAGLHRSQTSLGDYFRPMKARLGRPKAMIAAAHKLAAHRLSHGHDSLGIRHDHVPRAGASRSGPEANRTPSASPRRRFQPGREGGCSLGEPFRSGRWLCIHNCSFVQWTQEKKNLIIAALSDRLRHERSFS